MAIFPSHGSSIGSVHFRSCKHHGICRLGVASVNKTAQVSTERRHRLQWRWRDHTHEFPQSLDCHRSAHPKLPASEDGPNACRKRKFHRRYSAYPEDIKAELVGGNRLHGFALAPSSWNLSLGARWELSSSTRPPRPGVEVINNGTNILKRCQRSASGFDAANSFPNGADARQTTDEKYMAGGPELFRRKSLTGTRNLDLNKKRVQYETGRRGRIRGG